MYLSLILTALVWGSPIWETPWVTEQATAPLEVPLEGVMSSRFGPRTHPILNRRIRHQGVDIAAKKGSLVQASRAGLVTYAGWHGGHGRFVEIDHGMGWKSRYAHLRRLLVAKGDEVTTGAQIGLVGQSGLATGPHLHFEVIYGGQPIDPTMFFAKKNPGNTIVPGLKGVSPPIQGATN